MKNINTTGLDTICVLILNYQSYQDTINYVENLIQQKDVKLNILIVDNCSPNNSYEILKDIFFGVGIVEVVKSERNGGYAYGNNYGLKYIEPKSYDYVLISNNDIVIDDNYLLCKLVDYYKKLENPGFISPVMYVNRKPSKYPAWKMPTLISHIIGSLRLFEMIVLGRKSYSIEKNKEFIKVDCLPGSFFLGSKEVFFEMGLMDENTFLYMEEDIIAHKIKKLNLHNYLIVKLHYEHLTAKTIANEITLLKMRSHLMDSRVYFHKKYLKTNKVGIWLLVFLYKLWIIETFVYTKVMKLYSYAR